MSNPIIAMVRVFNFIRKPRIIKPVPMAAITSKMKMEKRMSNQMEKLTSVNSSINNHTPRDQRNRCLVRTSVLVNVMKTEAPERKTKVGAHKCVTHRVKKSAGVVVVKSVGDCVRAVTCMKSRV